SALLSAVKPLAEQAAKLRAEASPRLSGNAAAAAEQKPAPAAPFIAVVDAEQVRAAVTLALDAAMDSMVDEISRRVLDALNTNKGALQPQEHIPIPPAPAAP